MIEYLNGNLHDINHFMKVFAHAKTIAEILIEADYLVNAGESGYKESNIKNTLENSIKTSTGKALMQSIKKRFETLLYTKAIVYRSFLVENFF